MNESDLDAIELRDVSENLHRVAGEPPRDKIQETGWINPQKKIDYLIASAFTIEGKNWQSGRYSPKKDDTVFYAALDQKTACDEVAYHFPRKWEYLPSVKRGVPIKYLHFLCLFSGKIKDICVLSERFEELTADGHNDTTGFVARHARGSGADALISPSARNKPNGRCVVVFKRDTLSPLKIEQNVFFSLVPGTNETTYELRPYKEQPDDW